MVNKKISSIDIYFKVIAIYYNPNRCSYYYRIVNSPYYDIGYINSYGHKLVLVIPLTDIYIPKKVPLKKKLLMNVSSFIDKKIEKIK